MPNEKPAERPKPLVHIYGADAEEVGIIKRALSNYAVDLHQRHFAHSDMGYMELSKKAHNLSDRIACG